MLGSQVCWRLLLGWALLLGQPVFGDSDAGEEPPLAETQEPVSESQEPEDPVSESQDPEVPESPETTESPLTEEMPYLATDEDLEEIAKDARQRIEHIRNNPFSHSIGYLKQVALMHYNDKSKNIYVPYENGNTEVKKAIGTMIYVKFLMVKTSCTREEGEALVKQLLDSDYYSTPTEMKHCEVPPPSEQEIVECTFSLFRDARSQHWPRHVVVHHECVPFGEQ